MAAKGGRSKLELARYGFEGLQVFADEDSTAARPPKKVSHVRGASSQDSPRIDQFSRWFWVPDETSGYVLGFEVRFSFVSFLVNFIDENCVLSSSIMLTPLYFVDFVQGARDLRTAHSKSDRAKR